MQYPIINLSCQFFLSLFTICLPEIESLKVLDLFFLEGMQSNKLIFDVTLAYLRILEQQIVECSNFTSVIDPKNKAFDDPTLLMLEIKRARLQLKQSHIDFYRPVCHREVLNQVQQAISQKWKSDFERKLK
jgi:hypothetical protein